MELAPLIKSSQGGAPLLARLRAANVDYRLEAAPLAGAAPGALLIRPGKVHPPRVVEGCGIGAGGCAWRVRRAFTPAGGGFGVRLRALSAVKVVPAEGVGTVDLLLLQGSSKVVARTTRCTGSIGTVPVPHSQAELGGMASDGDAMRAAVVASPSGNLSLRLNYTRPVGGADVGCLRQRFVPSALNTSEHRALRVSVFGDGR